MAMCGGGGGGSRVQRKTQEVCCPRNCTHLHLCEVNETYADDAFHRTIQIRGPHPQGTKRLFFEFAPALVFKRYNDYPYDLHPSDITNRYPTWMQELSKLPGLCCISTLMNVSKLEFALCMHGQREELVKKIFCILRQHYPNQKTCVPCNPCTVQCCSPCNIQCPTICKR